MVDVLQNPEIYYPQDAVFPVLLSVENVSIEKVNSPKIGNKSLIGSKSE